jgi:endonuclease YncB( thermonuclease family)
VAEPSSGPRPSGSTVDVTYVIDGDTVVVSGRRHVRLVGIDTPERDQCGYDAATRSLQRLVLHQPVRLVPPAGEGDADRYGRLLRYVLVRGRDAGLAQIEGGYAVARYDSRDGYPEHPRERRYRDAAQAARARHTAVVSCP